MADAKANDDIRQKAVGNSFENFALSLKQPMTGIVLWEENDVDVKTQPGVIQLEYAYVPPSSIALLRKASSQPRCSKRT